MGTVAGCLRNTRAVEKHLHSDSQSWYCRLQAGCLQPCLSSQSRLTGTHDCLCWQCIPQLCCTLVSILAFNGSQTGIPQQNKHSARFDHGACTMAWRGSDKPHDGSNVRQITGHVYIHTAFAACNDLQDAGWNRAKPQQRWANWHIARSAIRMLFRRIWNLGA